MKASPQERVKQFLNQDRSILFFWLGLVSILAAWIILWLSIDWHWSFVDDPGQALTMRDLHSRMPASEALLTRSADLAAGDFSNGVFRPLAWIYPPLTYSLSVGSAHIVRLVMVMLTLIGPLIYFQRRGFRGPMLVFAALMLVTAASGLYEGLLLLSIQEVGGMMLVSLGLATNRPAGRLVFWILAALFKAPFLWILIGYGVFLFMTRQRKWAAVSTVSAIILFAVSVLLSNFGDYTDRYRLNPLDPELWNSASKILEPANGALLIAFVWWVIATKSPIQRTNEFPIFAIGFVGYYVQMIPWGFTAYYMGPISFLLGLVLLSVLSPHPQSTPLEFAVGLLLPIAVAVWIVKGSVSFVLQSNEIVARSTQCIAEENAQRIAVQGDWLYLTTSPEGPLRLAQNIEYFDRQWSGEIASFGQMTNETHLLVVNEDLTSQAGPLEEVCSGPRVQLFQVSSGIEGPISGDSETMP